jgi:hypothetical protein
LEDSGEDPCEHTLGLAEKEIILRRRTTTVCQALLCLAVLSVASAADEPGTPDQRIAVKMPARLVAQFKGSMRGYLATLRKVQAQMGAGDYAAASATAEDTLGTTAHARLLALRPLPEVLNYVPSDMRAIGDTLHTAASQFALVSKQTVAHGDSRKAWAAMSQILDSCVACHAAYRIEATQP